MANAACLAGAVVCARAAVRGAWAGARTEPEHRSLKAILQITHRLVNKWKRGVRDVKEEEG